MRAGKGEPQRYVLGVDGGNSKTIALIARLDGNVAGWGRAGCGDIYGAASEKAAIDGIERAVRRAAEHAEISTRDLAHGVFCLAGADWPEDIDLLSGALADRALAREVTVLNDAHGGLRAGAPDGIGVAVVCGTGAAIGARGAEGQSWHSGWWQEPQGSRQLAEKALRAIVRSELGIAGPTSLTGRLLAMFGSESVEACLHTLTARKSAARSSFAAFTPVLLEEAERGDAAARSIVRAHGAALGDFALAAAQRVGLSGGRFRLVLAGGVFRAEAGLLRRSLCARVCEVETGAQPVVAAYEPAVGALFLAFDAVGVGVRAGIEERLRMTMPPPQVFAT